MFTIINLILLLAILYIIYNLINNYENYENFKNNNFNLEDQNIDNLFIFERGKEYSNYINNLYDSKKILFSNKELEDLKKNSQIYNTLDNDDIQNITVQVTNSLNNKNNNLSDYNDFNDDTELIRDSNLEYLNIINNMEKNINKQIPVSCDDIAVLNNPRYLKNYYLDIFGNNINSTLSDYFADYETNINKKNQYECISVKTNKGNSNMIIPDQYDTNKYLTNAYNIDWSRIINPNTVY
jgi:hypothetical protein